MLSIEGKIWEILMKKRWKRHSIVLLAIEEYNGCYKIVSNFIRDISHSMDNFYSVTMDYIESQAYGAWMDGAK